MDTRTKLERADALALAMMQTRPDLAEMSLDEWLVEHWDRLSETERRAAQAIVDLHMTID